MTNNNPDTTKSRLPRPDDAEFSVHTFGEARHVAASLARNRVDFKIPANHLAFGGQNLLVNSHSRIQPLRGFQRGNQIHGQLAIEPGAIKSLIPMLPATDLRANFVLSNDPEAAAWNLSHFLQKMGKKEVTVRGMWGEDGGLQVRSIKSERYNTNLDSHEILEAYSALEINDSQGPRPLFPDEMVINGRVGRDTLSIYLPFPAISRNIADLANGGKSPYSAGIYIRDGETGNRSFSTGPFIQRGPCTNTIRPVAWDRFSFKRNHIGTTLAPIVVSESIEIIAELLDEGAEFSLFSAMQQMAEAATVELERKGTLEYIAQFVGAFGGGDTAKMRIAQFTEQYAPTRNGIAQGISEWSHTLPAVLQESAIQMAGDFLFTGRFGLPDAEVREEIAEYEFAEVRR